MSIQSGSKSVLDKVSDLLSEGADQDWLRPRRGGHDMEDDSLFAEVPVATLA